MHTTFCTFFACWVREVALYISLDCKKSISPRMKEKKDISKYRAKQKKIREEKMCGMLWVLFVLFFSHIFFPFFLLIFFFVGLTCIFLQECLIERFEVGWFVAYIKKEKKKTNRKQKEES